MRRKKAKKSSSHLIERCAVCLMLSIAWSWIMVTVGMVFYHGYYKKSGGNVMLSRETIRQMFMPGDERFRNALLPEPAFVDKGHISSFPAISSGSDHYLKPYESPLLIFTCNRDNYLAETLTDIQKIVPKDCSMGCPIVISQDGTNPKVTQVIKDFTISFGSIGIPVVHLQHQSSLRRGKNAYQALAVHYGWALQQVFDGGATAPHFATVLPQRAIILEEDLHTAPDFFDYFKAMAPLLDRDNTLLAVSAFNDNGYEDKVRDATRLLRSDFFPGLGWMMSGKLWRTELQSKWPSGYWDDWLREPAQRQDRHTIRPEISRTFHFGEKGGASSNQFGSQLSKVLLNSAPVDWSQQDVSSLDIETYNPQYLSLIEAAEEVPGIPEALATTKTTNARLEYKDFRQFQEFAMKLGLMKDEKAGIPRTAYYGVVETRPHGDHLLFLTPKMEDVRTSLNPAAIAS